MSSWENNVDLRLCTYKRMANTLRIVKYVLKDANRIFLIVKEEFNEKFCLSIECHFQIRCLCIYEKLKYSRLSEKCLSFTDAFFTNVKPNLSNGVIYTLIEQNGSYEIR